MKTKALKLILICAVAALATALTGVGTAAALAPKPVSLVSLGHSAPQGAAAAEIVAYHPASKQAFVTDSAHNQLDIFNLADPAAPVLTSSVDLAPYGGAPNSVTVSKVCGGRVIVAVEASPRTNPGTLEMFDINGVHLDSVTVGAQPDMVAATAGGKRFVSANEGEPSDDGTVDPAGSVSVATMRNCNTLRVATVGFSGVPLIGDVRVFGPGATAATNLEPEYVSIAPGGATAQVTVQEANAVATVNLASATITSVRSLGYKDLGLAGNAFDPSDKDGGIHIAPWSNVFGMYQPDAIAAYKLPKETATRYITANEGDSRDWTYFSEEKRVKELTLDPTVFASGQKADAKLGRLNVTNTQGDTDGDGDFDRLYAYGGRSVSVLDSAGNLAWDSGDAMEQYVAANAPAKFNQECGSGAFDTRSDNKGPEPEGVAVGRFNNRTYAFVGLERTGGILAMDLRAVPGQALIAGYVNDCSINNSPEGVLFVSESDSPTSEPLVLTANEVSGTLASYAVRKPGIDTTITGGPSGQIFTDSATFNFTATAPAAAFMCKLDGGATTACNSPHTYTGLSAETHSFCVFAIDTLGAPDPTPACRVFSVSAPAA